MTTAAAAQSLTLIVAATTRNGIGKNGGLPWPMLKKEMSYFARVTKHVAPGSPEGAQNVVVMGRKTWDSIPPKFRPLKDRINLIITSNQNVEAFGAPRDDVVVAQSIEHGLARLETRSAKDDEFHLGRIFIIGGSSIYAAALKLPNARRVLLTRIEADIDCDTYFPEDLDSGVAKAKGWELQSPSSLSKFTGDATAGEPQMEHVKDQAFRYQFTMYERVS